MMDIYYHRGLVLRDGTGAVVRTLMVQGWDRGSIAARMDEEQSRYPGTTATVLAPEDPTWTDHFVDPNAPPGPPPPDPDEALAVAIAAATTLQELKDALLGNVAAGRVKGRPV